MQHRVRYWIVRRGRVLALAAGTLCLVVGGGVSALQAELTWPAKTVELHADAKATVLEARFPFANRGTTPVDIGAVQTGCGCTTVTLAQRHYDPGQSGEIVAHFTVGGRVGLQQKTITVTTSDQPMPTALSLIVHVPELVRLEPNTVSWTVGEPNTAKVIDVVALQADPPLREVTVRSLRADIKAVLEPSATVGKYRISVSPGATDRPRVGVLIISGRIGAEEKTFRAFASVLPSPPALGVAPAAVKPATSD